jgi:diguanylate cyclase (GGDEF)-like protein
VEKDLGAKTRFEDSIRNAFDAAEKINERGNEGDRALLSELQAKLSPQIGQAFVLLNTLDMDELGSIDPRAALTIDDLYGELSGPAESRHQEALRSLSAYRHGQTLRSILTLAAFAVGIPLLLGLRMAMKHYENEHHKRSQEVAKLKEAALTDNLTSLGNHRAFQEELRRLSSSAALAGSSLAVAIIDVDDFKMVNDENGHGEGDRVLAELAELMTYTRPDDRGYRVGGDEFALIMPGLDGAGAAERMDGLRGLMAKAMSNVTVSIGLAAAGGADIDPELLRERAHIALYEAKRSGKNQVSLFQGDFYQKGNVPAAKARAFRELLSAADVAIAFQPIVTYEDHGVLAFEALARPGGDAFDGPYEAFEVADKLSRTWELDQICIAKAFESYRHLPQPAVLFVNLDPRSLTNSQFDASLIAALAASHGVQHSRVVIELTERTAIPGSLLLHGLDSLREAGFRVALDDVGSGNSGLELLRSAKFDFVKIDRSVIVSALDRGPGRAVVSALVALGNEIGANVIAEGVEDTAMLDVVRAAITDRPQLSIMGLQGYLFGRPAILKPGAAAA